MPDERHPCPDEETLGAFLDARLEGAERLAIVAHLATCDRCIAGSEFVTRMRNAEPAADVIPIHPWRKQWLIAAAIVVVVSGTAFFIWRGVNRRETGIPALIAAAPVRYRTLEPRLAGFRWAAVQRLREEPSTTTDPEVLRLGGAAADVFLRAQHDASAEAAHAAGVAELLLQKPGEAAERLRDAAVKEPKAETWNDLAAAYYTDAVREGHAAELPRALAAADKALAIAPDLSEARFNRALILERMGLRAEAAAAWREYLQRDGSSDWAAEARRHLEALQSGPTTSPQARLERLERAATMHDQATVDVLVREGPQDARAWMETDVLGRWGEAMLAGDRAAASRLLDAAGNTGAALQRFSGESLLADSTAVIAGADDRRRILLARAHAAFRRGRLAFRDHHDEASAILLDAAHDFDEAKSPMGDMARLFAASVYFDSNRIDDAATLLDGITAIRYDALHAQVALRLADCRMYQGRWEDAVHGFQDAAARFERLHESSNAASAEAGLGDAYDELGARDEAWTQRTAAFRNHGRDAASALRLIATVAAGARSELRAEQWEEARSLLRVEADVATDLGDPIVIADVWRRRSLVDAHLGDDEAAREDVARCRTFLSRAKPSGLSDRFLAEVKIAEAAVVGRHDAPRAIALLTSTIDFLSAAGERMALPDALLERGRALRDRAQPAEALRDFGAALAEVEVQRRVAPPGAPVFDAVAPLVEETIALQLARSDAPAAFATAERAHAQASGETETTPATTRQVAAALAPGEMLIAYALVPDGIAAIGVTRDGIKIAQQRVDRRQLADSVRALRASIAARDDLPAVEARSSKLDRMLFAPIAGMRTASSLVIVPDRFLQSVPWTALYDEEHRAFAIEVHAVTVAPSASLWLRSRTPRPKGPNPRLLLVTSAARVHVDPLDHISTERNEIAASYGERMVLDSGEATPQRFLSAASDADVVHFAGHARAGPEPALLLGESGELRASDIARAYFVRPRLVVLAACGTAAGDGDGFEGAHGLVQAFLTAGVPAVVGTLWPVDDAEAAALFIAFHQRLRAGDDAAAALREAQLSLLNGSNPRSRHPAAWAAAELFGGVAPIARR
ncbi:MAG TPA: CHAT domain-containing tetratricopeptide repeat protein [Thermoanaerobaculia bacterium]|jgi:CHAT domain-containing protein|nr:CHAT domain-containing tetratricopeptide repeat protein [Thermoanaerobaculia bacterium]